jgi:hypothetical protein
MTSRWIKNQRRFGGTYQLHLQGRRINRAIKQICFHTGFSLAYSSILKMEEICSSETSVDTQRSRLRYIPEDGTLHNHRCENLKSYALRCVWRLYPFICPVYFLRNYSRLTTWIILLVVYLSLRIVALWGALSQDPHPSSLCHAEGLREHSALHKGSSRRSAGEPLLLLTRQSVLSYCHSLHSSPFSAIETCVQVLNQQASVLQVRACSNRFRDIY